MHEYFLSVFLGIVEGLTEFLPVSSTAHLRICEALLHIDLHDGFWKMYTIVIQLGAILALPVYFWHRILQFVRTFPKGERGDRTIFTHPLSLTLIAFVVTAVPAWALAKQIGKNLENLWVMALALLIGGIVMWIVDTVFTRPRTMHMEEMTLPQAVWIGAAQILSAIFFEDSDATPSRGGYCTTGNESARVDCARYRIHCFVFRSTGRCRLVYELGAYPWVCAVRALPDCSRHRTVDVIDAWHHVINQSWQPTLFFRTCKVLFFVRTSGAKSTVCKRSWVC